MRWGLSAPEGTALSLWWLHHQGGRWQEALQPLAAMFGGLCFSFGDGTNSYSCIDTYHHIETISVYVLYWNSGVLQKEMVNLVNLLQHIQCSTTERWCYGGAV